jgi:hypothetical protein
VSGAGLAAGGQFAGSCAILQVVQIMIGWPLYCLEPFVVPHQMALIRAGLGMWWPLHVLRIFLKMSDLDDGLIPAGFCLLNRGHSITLKPKTYTLCQG